ncbi:MAG TPA: carboxypeptidase-like regulatory domain-containing protein [Panacibacter sp.]|nr:carboxypeptidase-like regulatory domain-containing protein [Panacibacter sp.]HNP43336.1 carboxypeptidase-like regulatory domain-containing protein [Panacibacter sp.]
MKVLLIISCFLFFCCQNTNAARNTTCKDCSFTGVVTDALTKKPIPNVVVTAKTIETNEAYKVTTDEFGQYQLPSLPNGTYNLRFEYDNYRTVEKRNVVVKKSPAKLNIELINPEQIEEDHHNWLMKFDI